VIDARAFGKLEPGDQVVVQETVAHAARELDAAARSGEQDARKALQEQGIEFVSAATPEEVERWHAIAGQSLAVLRKKQIYTDEMIDEMLRHLEEYRRQSQAGHEQ